MRAIIIAALLLSFLIGTAGATVANGTGGIYGPYGGFYNPGTIESGGLIVHGSGDMSGDLAVRGAVSVTGTVTDGATVSSGTIGHWAMMGANLPFTCLGTTNVFDWSNSTGAFTTSSGTVRLRGTTLIGPQTGKALTVSGLTTTNTFLNNGTSMLYGTVLVGPTNADPKGITSSGAGRFATLRVNSTSELTGVVTFTAAPLFNAGVVIPSGQSLSASTTTGAGAVDFGGMSGTFKGVAGATTLNSTTINTGKTLAVTDADALTVGTVIVPVLVPIKYDFDKNSSYNRSIAAMDGAWKVVEIDESHSTVASSGCKMYLGKATGTQVPIISGGASRGVSLTAASIDATSTINTVVQPALNATAGNTAFATHDRIFINFVGGNVGAVVGQVTIWMKRV